MQCADVRLLDAAYVYLLGMYLGDGVVSRHPRNVWRLRIFQDSRYVELIAACKSAMESVIGRQARAAPLIGCHEISAYWKHWPCVFPQVGPGEKHKRTIELAAWQTELVMTFPRAFIKGLIESDGCRIINFANAGGKRYEYPRYFFSNRSVDIQGLFRWACDLVGIEYRQDGPWQISVAKRASVALLDEFIGPKR